MLAFALSLILLAFWTVLGLALLVNLRTGLTRLQEILLAPVTGVLCTMLPIFIINRAGAPIKSFGVALTIGLAIAAASGLFVRRKTLAIKPRDYFPVGLLLLFTLFITGWPMLQFGFDWLSLCNDDMANYVLGGTRFYNSGWFELPSLEKLTSGSDYTHTFWFFHVLSLSRGGCEQLIAWTMSLTGKSGHEIYMPLILALNLTLVSASGALIPKKVENRSLVFTTIFLVGISALTAFGALYQLIAQVAGLPILIALAVVLFRRFDTSSWQSLFSQAALIGFYASGLLIIYPEVAPIISVAWIFFLIVSAAQRDFGLKGFLIVLPLSVLAAVVILRQYFMTSAVYLLGQTKGGTANNPGGDFFPFYRIPSGLAAVWGFKPVFRPLIDPWISILIAIAIVLMMATIAAVCWAAWKRRLPAAMLCLVMFMLAIVLYKNEAGFGLYKLAMFIQPFMLSVVALTWFTLVKSTKWRMIPLLLLALPGFWIQQAYVNYSRGLNGVFLEIPEATEHHITREFREMLARHPAPNRLLLDTHNVVLAKYQSIYTLGRPTAIPGNGFGLQMMGFPIETPAGEELKNVGLDVATAVDKKVEKLKFNLRPEKPTSQPTTEPVEETDPDAPADKRKFRIGLLETRFANLDGDINQFVMTNMGYSRSPGDLDNTLFIGETAKQSLFNRYNGAAGAKDVTSDFFAMPLRDVKNHLIFVPSELGRLYGYKSQKLISVYQLEIDPNYYIGTTFAGIGRFTLFNPINPTKNCRFMVELCCSLKGDSENRLPNADVIGDKRYKLPLIGRGSARVWSPPIRPQIINGRPYICLDLGEAGKTLPEVRTGLARMYGRDVPIDWRRLVAFARDVSLVSDEQYSAMRGPTSVDFDIDEKGLLRGAHPLRNKSLEYSGIYEDAWCSDAAFVHLTQPAESTELKIVGSISRLPTTSEDFTQEITVLLDGVEVAKQSMGMGPFEIRVPVEASAAGQRRVDLRFTKTQQFPYPDLRPIACQLRHVGYELPAGARSQIESFPGDLSNPKFKFTGLSRDGWMPKESSIDLTQLPEQDTLVLRAMVPNLGDPAYATEVTVLIDGAEVAKKKVGIDQFEMRIPVEGTASSLRHVEVKFSDVRRLSADDDRMIGAQLRYLGFQRAQPPAPADGN